MKAQFCFIFNAQNKVQTIYRFFGVVTEETPKNNTSNNVVSCDGNNNDNCGTVKDADGESK